MQLNKPITETVSEDEIRSALREAFARVAGPGVKGLAAAVGDLAFWDRELTAAGRRDIYESEHAASERRRRGIDLS